MPAQFRRAVAALVLVGFAGAAAAQWDPYPSAGIPLDANGEPDMAGLTPRTFDGRPDLSGIWEAINGERGPVDGQLGRGPNVEPPPGSPPVAHFFDIGAQFDPPYTEWGDRTTQERIDDDARGNPDAYCLPMGPMQFHLHPQPRKIIQTRDLVVIINEVNGGVRQIFLDGRKLPDPEEAWPWWFGYSIGHWEGDTLVVESAGYRDDVWLDYNGSPLTSSGRLTERYRRTNFGTLEIDVTVEDPQAYTEPFTVRVNQRLLLDTDLIEFVCIENEVSSQYYYAEGE
ncbi:MAG: hypothetical protein PVH89_10215 [Gammaproteobacteria bacterium]